MIKSYKTQGATSFGVAPSFLISPFGLLKLTIRYALVCVDAFYYILMIVVGCRLHNIKSIERFAIQATDNPMYRLRQRKLIKRTPDITILRAERFTCIAICLPGLRVEPFSVSGDSPDWVSSLSTQSVTICRRTNGSAR